jgi:hypothetical protein
MSDTTEQECACCGFDTDCIDGLCQSCNDFNYKLEKLHKQVLNKPITEHPDVQRLIKQVVLDGFKIKELQAKNNLLNKLKDVVKVCREINDSGEEYTAPNADAAQVLCNLFSLLD